MKRSPIRRVSEKRSEQIPERQEMRRKQLRGDPRCEAKIEGVCQVRATDVHELINRSQMKNSWLTPELFVSLCRPCHSWATVHPLWSRKHGLQLRAHENNESSIYRANQVRGQCKNKDCTDDHMTWAND